MLIAQLCDLHLIAGPRGDVPRLHGLAAAVTQLTGLDPGSDAVL